MTKPASLVTSSLCAEPDPPERPCRALATPHSRPPANPVHPHQSEGVQTHVLPTASIVDSHATWVVTVMQSPVEPQ